MKIHQINCFRRLIRLSDNNIPARTALKCLNWEAKKALIEANQGQLGKKFGKKT